MELEYSQSPTRILSSNLTTEQQYTSANNHAHYKSDQYTSDKDNEADLELSGRDEKILIENDIHYEEPNSFMQNRALEISLLSMNSI